MGLWADLWPLRVEFGPLRAMSGPLRAMSGPLSARLGPLRAESGHMRAGSGPLRRRANLWTQVRVGASESWFAASEGQVGAFEASESGRGL